MNAIPKIKDLEPLIPSLFETGNFDAESAIMRFGHGDCHDLTAVLVCKYNAKPLVIVSSESKTIVHSCVLLDEFTTLDAYGINKLNVTLERYSKLTLIGMNETAIASSDDLDWDEQYRQLIESPEDLLEDFKPVLELLDTNLRELFC
ncbi:hypothetical protein [Vibrio sp. D431a]|uniref:hypothetical protein n=1 Tax=Vibrio sp. D431a TaxID=2837388 RepID=UPI0025541F8A|nr:hypothetical protein [Vibrio sp. D431a]MDK9789752.1 hypothetical protein [Vibrio sp. D431a]